MIVSCCEIPGLNIVQIYIATDSQNIRFDLLECRPDQLNLLGIERLKREIRRKGEIIEERDKY